MYKLKFLIVASFATVLVACTTGHTSTPIITDQQVGTVVDASPVANPPTYGTLDGLVLSGTIGKAMNQQDKINTQQALVATPMGQQAVWTNTKTKTSYTIKPVNEYQSGSSFCRQAQILINDGKQTAYTTICRGPDGKWYVKQ